MLQKRIYFIRILLGKYYVDVAWRGTMRINKGTCMVSAVKLLYVSKQELLISQETKNSVTSNKVIILGYHSDIRWIEGRIFNKYPFWQSSLLSFIW